MMEPRKKPTRWTWLIAGVIALVVITIAFLLWLSQYSTRIINQIPGHETSNRLFIKKHHIPEYQLSATIQAQWKSAYLQHYYFPWTHPENIVPFSAVKVLEQQEIVKYAQHPGWGEEKHPHTRAWIHVIANNMALSTFPNHKQRAIVTHVSNLRALPTNIPTFTNWKDPGQGYPFDNFQVSYLWIGLPVYITQLTKDHEWALVIAPNKVIGWVPSTNLATIDDAFAAAWQAHPYLTPIKDHYPVLDAEGNYLQSTTIGHLYPLLNTGSQNDQILSVVKTATGTAKYVSAQVAHVAMQTWPIPANTLAIATLADQMMGGPYGWGGLYGYRDCSTTQMNLWAAFGLWLPRNSTDQAREGQQHSLIGLTPSQKREFINTYGIPYFSLLHKEGHIMLYIGSVNRRPYIFHAPWGLKTWRPFHHSRGRAVIGRSVITPADIGHDMFDVPFTLLDKDDDLTNLTNRMALTPAYQKKKS